LVKDFLAKFNVTTLEHPPHSPNLAEADFYLLPQLKLVLMGWCFYDTTDIVKNAPDELKKISQNGLNEYFQNLDSRWQKRKFVKGNYFKGNVD
jgi:hypothetical protein